MISIILLSVFFFLSGYYLAHFFKRFSYISDEHPVLVLFVIIYVLIFTYGSIIGLILDMKEFYITSAYAIGFFARFLQYDTPY